MVDTRHDWETMVNHVCVMGDPAVLGELAGSWDVVLVNGQSLAAEIRSTIKQLEPAFGGPAGEAYRETLEKIAKSLDDIKEKSKDVTHMLRDAAGSLSTAQATMPVPDNMLDEVRGRQEELAAANRAGMYAIFAMGGGLATSVAVPAASGFFLGTGDFRNAVANSWVGNLGREVFGKIDSWINDETDAARKIYGDVDQQYGQTEMTAANPQPVVPQVAYNPTDTNLGGGGGGGGLGSAGGLGSSPGIGGGGFDPSASGAGGAPDFGAPGTGTVDPGTGGLGGAGGLDDPPGTGLAGAGGGLGAGGLGGGGAGSLSPGGGLGAGGLGGGGLGSGGGLGAGGVGAGGLGALGTGGAGARGAGRGGARGLGAGGLGAMGSGAGARGGGTGRSIGRGVSPGGMVGGGGGRAGAGGARTGAAGARGGVGGGMAGGRPGVAGEHEADHDSWLVEDDDVWGSDETPPNLLG
jgi:hypothetical protein